MKSNEWTVVRLIHAGAELLDNAGIPDARFDAGCLMEHCLGQNASGLAACLQTAVREKQAYAFWACIERRLCGEPLQYILGEWEFMGLRFFVGPGVLIPRPDTETLVECACAYLRNHPEAIVYDLCAGSGCIGLSVANAHPAASVYLIEKSGDAFAFLQRNAALHNLSNITLLQKDIFDTSLADLPVPDLILSNPPYIPAAQLPTLQREVRQEPAMALDGGADGLMFYRLLAERFLPLLSHNGMAAVECGEDQASSVASLFLQQGFATQRLRDLNGIERVVAAYPALS